MRSANSRLAFDFDRAAVIVAALSSKPISPMSLNPYRKNQRTGMSVEEFQEHAERRFKSMQRAGKKVHRDVITSSQFVNDE